MLIKVRDGQYSWRTGEPVRFDEIEIECEGSGSKEDPAIIDSSIKFPKGNIDIVESELYIVIADHDIKLLTLRHAKNVTIKNCTFNSLLMVDCNVITIENTHSSYLRWAGNQDCKVIDSVTEEQFQFYKCSNNIFKNCEFWNFFNFDHEYSKGNKFENCDFSGTLFVPSKEAFYEIQKPGLKHMNTYSLGVRSETEEVEYSGSGVKDNPFIIDRNNIQDQKIREISLFCKRDYVVLKNFNIKRLILYDCSHITLERCNISKLCLLKFCNDIKMIYVSLKTIKFGACLDTIIENSDIKKIDFYKGYVPVGRKMKGINLDENVGEKVIFKECSYQKIKKGALPTIDIK